MERTTRAELTIVVRGYEMDATATVSISRIARYFEHARWTVMRGQQFVMSEYWQRGVIRAQLITRHRNLRYGVDGIITTWIGRIGKTSFDFVHELRHASSGALVATSRTTAVNVDPDGRPKPLDPGAQEAIGGPEGDPYPSFDDAHPHDAYRREIIARPSEQDVLQHVNHASYIDYVEDTRWFATREAAYGPDTDPRKPKQLWIDYSDQAHAGDRLVVRSWKTEAGFAFLVAGAEGGAVYTRALVTV